MKIIIGQNSSINALMHVLQFKCLTRVLNVIVPLVECLDYISLYSEPVTMHFYIM